MAPRPETGKPIFTSDRGRKSPDPEDGGLSQSVPVCYGFVRENAHD